MPKKKAIITLTNADAVYGGTAVFNRLWKNFLDKYEDDVPFDFELVQIGKQSKGRYKKHFGEHKFVGWETTPGRLQERVLLALYDAILRARKNDYQYWFTMHSDVFVSPEDLIRLWKYVLDNPAINFYMAPNRKGLVRVGDKVAKIQDLPWKYYPPGQGVHGFQMKLFSHAERTYRKAVSADGILPLASCILSLRDLAVLAGTHPSKNIGGKLSTMGNYGTDFWGCLDANQINPAFFSDHKGRSTLSKQDLLIVASELSKFDNFDQIEDKKNAIPADAAPVEFPFFHVGNCLQSEIYYSTQVVSKALPQQFQKAINQYNSLSEIAFREAFRIMAKCHSSFQHRFKQGTSLLKSQYRHICQPSDSTLDTLTKREDSLRRLLASSPLKYYLG